MYEYSRSDEEKVLLMRPAKEMGFIERNVIYRARFAEIK